MKNKASTPLKMFIFLGFMVMGLGVITCLISSCGTSEPSGSGPKQSLKRDTWGHRPGPRGFRTVIIDAGHGGKDSGALGRYSAVEKHLTLDTAKRLKRKLKGKFRVKMIRSTDGFVELDDRVAFANRYHSAILVSLHYNSSRSRASRGPETYYWRVDSFSLAKRIQRELRKVSHGGNRNRGLVRRRLRLTRNTKIPSVLVELGYISNSSEARRCSKSSRREKLASAVARAIRDQRAHGDDGMGALPRPIYKPLSRASDRHGS